MGDKSNMDINKEKIISEIIELLKKDELDCNVCVYGCSSYEDWSCDRYEEYADIAETLYDAGYRKVVKNEKV